MTMTMSMNNDGDGDGDGDGGTTPPGSGGGDGGSGGGGGGDGDGDGGSSGEIPGTDPNAENAEASRGDADAPAPVGTPPDNDAFADAEDGEIPVDIELPDGTLTMVVYEDTGLYCRGSTVSIGKGTCNYGCFCNGSPQTCKCPVRPGDIPPPPPQTITLGSVANLCASGTPGSFFNLFCNHVTIPYTAVLFDQTNWARVSLDVLTRWVDYDVRSRISSQLFFSTQGAVVNANVSLLLGDFLQTRDTCPSAIQWGFPAFEISGAGAEFSIPSYTTDITQLCDAIHPYSAFIRRFMAFIVVLISALSVIRGAK